MKKLSAYADEQGIQYRAAWNRFKAGKISGAWKDEFGHIWVPDQAEDLENKAMIYARVSTSRQKDDLDRQAERLREFAISRGYEVVGIIKEVASGVNDSRPKLQQVIHRKDEWGTLIVEHEDRLTRVGFGYFEMLLGALLKTVLVADPSQDSDEGRMEDVFSILYSFAASEYGKRGAKYRAERAARALEGDAL